MTSTKEFSIVIGGGPGGSSAAIYLARFNHPVILLDAGELIRGRTSWAYHMENIIGFTKEVEGPELLIDLHAQLEKFGVEYKKEIATLVTKNRNSFKLTTDQNTYEASFVILAVGVQDIMPNIPDPEAYFGHSLFSCPTCNWYQTKDQPTGIITNDDHGITTALEFKSMQPNTEVHVLTDRPHPNFTKPMLNKAKNQGITVHESPILTLNGKPEHLASVSLSDETVVPVEILYTKLGVKRTDTFLDPKKIPLERDAGGYIEVNFQSMESSHSNLFAVGPCNTGPDQVMVAAGQGVTAAMEIHRRILETKGI